MTDCAPSEPIERVTIDSPDRAGHEMRYRLAAGFIRDGDTVLDAACGIGYGVALVDRSTRWIGVDIADVVHPDFVPLGCWIVADLCAWQPDEPFDVALSFETLEHVEKPEAVIDLLCQARRTVICSVPIVPTVGLNPFHLHDFTLWDIPRGFAERGWSLNQCLLQPAELSAIYVFER